MVQEDSSRKALLRPSGERKNLEESPNQDSLTPSSGHSSSLRDLESLGKTLDRLKDKITGAIGSDKRSLSLPASIRVHSCGQPPQLGAQFHLILTASLFASKPVSQTS